LTGLIAASVLGALLVLPLAGGASGNPPGKVFKRVGSVNIDGAQGTIGMAVARCREGERAVSGGWFMTDPEETELLVFESRRLGGRGWVVKAIQATANSFDTDLLAFAYCDPDANRAKRVATTTTVASGETAGADAKCPKGTKAVAGGFSAPFDASFNAGGFPVESKRVGRRTWRVAAHAPNPEGATLTTDAYCGKRVGRLRKRSDSTRIEEIGDYRVTSSGRCPKRIGARSGGFSFGNQTDALFSVPLSDAEGRRWQVSARNLGGSPTPLRSFAYCS